MKKVVVLSWLLTASICTQIPSASGAVKVLYSGTGEITLPSQVVDKTERLPFVSSGILDGGMRYNTAGALYSLLPATKDGVPTDAFIGIVLSDMTISNSGGVVFSEGTFHGEVALLDDGAVMNGTLVASQAYGGVSYPVNIDLSYSMTESNAAAPQITTPEPGSLALLVGGVSSMLLPRRKQH